MWAVQHLQIHIRHFYDNDCGKYSWAQKCWQSYGKVTTVEVPITMSPSVSQFLSLKGENMQIANKDKASNVNKWGKSFCTLNHVLARIEKL